ncbi:MAG: tetratricopeptide repeat protein [Acidobacteriota bacterium]
MALSAAGLWGQMTQMTGVVLGLDGKPVQGAEVLITRTDIKANYKIKTDKKGKFNYATLPKGVYDVQINVEGQRVYDMKGMPTDYSKPAEIEVDMAKIAKEQAAQAPVQAAAPAPGAASAPGQQAAAVQPGAPAAPPAADPGLTPEQIAAAQAKYEKEMKEYQEAENKDKNLQTAFNAGVEAATAKNWAAAIENFTKASTVDPKQDAVWGRLGEAYQRQAEGARGADRLTSYNKAAESFLKAVELKPELADYRYLAAITLARSNKLDEAQVQLTKGAELDPAEAPRGYTNLGNVYFDTNRGEAAEAAYKKAIELDPKAANAYMGLGRTLVQRVTDQNGKAIAPPGTTEAFQSYLELMPNGPDAPDAKAMLEFLGAPLTNSIRRTPAGNVAAPAKPAPAKAKGR